MSKSLGLVTLYCRDLERARAFYTETLGLAIAPEFTGPEFIFLALGSAGIALRPLSAALEGAQAGSGSIELTILVDDVDATYADLTAKGVDIRTEIGDVGAGRAFFVRDPEGHMLAFAQLYEAVKAGRAKYGM
jgi:catechol 2,3-dioxygenase-like lactoylglutathione lyase family enzyme